MWERDSTNYYSEEAIMKTSLTFILFICTAFGAVLESAIKDGIIEKGKSGAYLNI